MTPTSPTAIPKVDPDSTPIPDSSPLRPIEAALAATQASAPIEPEEGFFSDDNSSSAESNASTTVSSYVWDYNYENGRRDHNFAQGRYVFPNDEDEQDREDMKHAMIVNICVGDEYPSASILGIDLSPIQPLWVPLNVRFMVDDAESPWLDGENLYDLVHARYITSAIKYFSKHIKTAHSHVSLLFPIFEFTGSISADEFC